MYSSVCLSISPSVRPVLSVFTITPKLMDSSLCIFHVPNEEVINFLEDLDHLLEAKKFLKSHNVSLNFYYFCLCVQHYSKSNRRIKSNFVIFYLFSSKGRSDLILGKIWIIFRIPRKSLKFHFTFFHGNTLQ